ncbi:MAG TPA: NAD(P)-binding protein [Nitrolancea sp.]|nr:NAD(P)-binding protein [Nitrolancea sp.]
MYSRSLRVIIIGAGLGGLTLAQGLHRAGVNVAVYERDPTANIRGQGYRIHLDTRGTRGLYDCLPPDLYGLVVETSGKPGRQLTILSAQLKQLRVIRFTGQVAAPDPATFSAPVDRFTVRQILLNGLDNVV